MNCLATGYRTWVPHLRVKTVRIFVVAALDLWNEMDTELVWNYPTWNNKIQACRILPLSRRQSGHRLLVLRIRCCNIFTQRQGRVRIGRAREFRVIRNTFTVTAHGTEQPILGPGHTGNFIEKLMRALGEANDSPVTAAQLTLAFLCVEFEKVDQGHFLATQPRIIRTSTRMWSGLTIWKSSDYATKRGEEAGTAIESILTSG